MAFIAAYATDQGPRYGLVIDGMIYACDGDLFQPESLQPGRVIGPVEDVPLAPPVSPSKIVCVGRNYAAHAAEHNAEVPQEPMLFLKPPSAIIGHQAIITIPAGIGRVDHEAELAVIIGKPAKNVSRAVALDYVLGFTCANDVSARDLQRKDGQWGRAKGFDTFCPLGPWLATELDIADCAVRAYVNGQLKQDSSTARMVFDIPTLIATISQVMTLLPGDLILTGTPAGVSPLAEGDVVDIEIEGIGRLRNPVRVMTTQ